MADEDPLNALRSSLQKSGLDSADASSRQSRALRRPIDATPETFMGASVAAVTDGFDAANSEEGAPDAAPPRRVKRVPRNRAAAAGVTVLDPNLFSQFANALGGVADKTSIAGATEEKIAPASPSPAASPLQKESTPELGKSSLEPMKLTPEPREPTAAPKIPTPPPVALNSPPSRMVVREEDEEAIKQAALAAKRDSALPPTPAVANVLPSPPDTEERVERLSKELETLRQQYEEDKEKLEDYEALCENLVPDAKSGARPLAHFISDLMESNDQLDEMRQAQVKIQQELSDLHEKLARETSKNAELSTTMTAMQEQQQQHLASAVDNSTLVSLQDALVAKDEEIAQLREQLKQSSMAATAGTMTFPSREEIEKMRQEEDEAFQMAEKELEMMEALIKEQEEYLARMEEHLGAFDFEGKSLSELQKAKEHLSTLAIDEGSHEVPSPGGDLGETAKEPEDTTL